MNTSILVVLYDKKIYQSQTLVSLKELPVNLNNFELVIWNNGPDELDKSEKYHCEFFASLEEKFCFVNIIETIDNISLSKIYNKFINDSKLEKYIILDHDSYLNIDYINDVINKNNLLLLPKVLSNGQICSPSKLPKDGITYPAKRKLSAITSGMVINHQLVSKMNKRFGSVFDEHYAFYGIDTTFMLRMRQLGLCNKISIIRGFDHSLSKNEFESEQIKLFRSKEMAISTALTTRHYPSYSSYRRFIKSIIRSLKGKNDYPIKTMLSAYISGFHPKCK